MAQLERIEQPSDIKALTAPQLLKLARYGRDIGLAFQLIDDVHDQEGLAQAMGAESALAEAGRLIARAVNAVEPFGKRGQMLRQLAEWLQSTSDDGAIGTHGTA